MFNKSLRLKAYAYPALSLVVLASLAACEQGKSTVSQVGGSSPANTQTPVDPQIVVGPPANTQTPGQQTTTPPTTTTGGQTTTPPTTTTTTTNPPTTTTTTTTPQPPTDPLALLRSQVPKSQMKVWLDASKISGVNDGHHLKEWKDGDSGSNIKASQPLAGAQPYFQKSTKSVNPSTPSRDRPSVCFTRKNAGDDHYAVLNIDLKFLAKYNAAAYPNYTVFVVYTDPNATTDLNKSDGKSLIAGDQAVSSGNLILGFGGAYLDPTTQVRSIYPIFSTYGNDLYATKSQAYASVGETRIMQATFSTAFGHRLLTYNRDGTVNIAQNDNVAGLDTYESAGIGGTRANNWYYEGCISEILIYNRSNSSDVIKDGVVTDTGKIISYLKYKYGML